MSDEIKLGSSFWVNLNLNYNGFDIKPFVNVNHKTLGEAGVIVYKRVGSTEFNVGLSYAPKSKLSSILNKTKSQLSQGRVTLIFGTSFKDITDIFLKDKKGKKV